MKHGERQSPRVLTARSTGMGIATGVLVAVLLGPLIGAPWGLAVLNGVAGGGLSLLVSYARRLGRLGFGPRTVPKPVPGISVVGHLVMQAPIVFVWMSMELHFASELALSLLFAFTALVAYLTGDAVATLGHLEGDDSAD